MGRREAYALLLRQQLWCYKEPLQSLNGSWVSLEMWMLCVHVSTHRWHWAGGSWTWPAKVLGWAHFPLKHLNKNPQRQNCRFRVWKLQPVLLERPLPSSGFWPQYIKGLAARPLVNHAFMGDGWGLEGTTQVDPDRQTPMKCSLASPAHGKVGFPACSGCPWESVYFFSFISCSAVICYMLLSCFISRFGGNLEHFSALHVANNIILSFPLISCVTMGKSLNLAEPQFAHFVKTALFWGLFWSSNW